MSTVQDIVNTPAVNSTLAASASTSSEIQDRFLKLLITQLKNQDPLNPMDNAQITSQMAQVSTVGGIEKLNTTLQSLSASLMSSQSLQATSLIGHTVYVESNNLAFSGGTPVSGGIDLAQSVDSLRVNIVGPAGNVVRQLDLGAHQSGLATFQWDGLSDGGAQAAAGTYSFQVTATSGGQKVPATSLASGQVSSVTLGTDGVQAIVKGIGNVTMQQINRIM